MDRSHSRWAAVSGAPFSAAALWGWGWAFAFYFSRSQPDRTLHDLHVFEDNRRVGFPALGPLRLRLRPAHRRSAHVSLSGRHIRKHMTSICPVTADVKTRIFKPCSLFTRTPSPPLPAEAPSGVCSLQHARRHGLGTESALSERCSVFSRRPVSPGDSWSRPVRSTWPKPTCFLHSLYRQSARSIAGAPLPRQARNQMLGNTGVRRIQPWSPRGGGIGRATTWRTGHDAPAPPPPCGLPSPRPPPLSHLTSQESGSRYLAHEPPQSGVRGFG